MMRKREREPGRPDEYDVSDEVRELVKMAEAIGGLDTQGARDDGGYGLPEHSYLFVVEPRTRAYPDVCLYVAGGELFYVVRSVMEQEVARFRTPEEALALFVMLKDENPDRM